MRTARVAVVLVNHECQADLLRCLSGLEAPSEWDLRVIVVDVSPLPDTAELQRSHPAVEVIRPEANRGFGAGCNTGIARALEDDAEFVFLLNPDTLVPAGEGPRLLGLLVGALRANPLLGATTPTLLAMPPARRVLYAGGEMTWWRGGPRHRRRLGGAADPAVVETPFASGCALMLRAETLREVGPLETEYFLYFEDADYVERCRDSGWGAAWVPDARLHHRESGSIDRRGSLHAYLYSRNRLWFLRRWSPAGPRVLYVLFTLLVKIPGAFLLLGPRLGIAFARGVVHGLGADRLQRSGVGGTSRRRFSE